MLYSTALAAAFAALACAMPEITSPASGSSNPVSAGTNEITVEWKDDGKAPKITELKSYMLQLMVGGNTESDSAGVTAGTSTAFGSSTSTKFEISAAMADDVKNGFYFKMTSVASEGGQVITYSPRFSLTGMTGTTDKKFIDAAADAGTKVPSNEDQTSNNADAADGVDGANSGVPFASQTGPIRFAPMQSVPPTKITKKDTKPLYPTSSYKIAVSFLPTPSVTKTETAKQTFSADSMENTASALPGPEGDMHRFLNRWKD